MSIRKLFGLCEHRWTETFRSEGITFVYFWFKCDKCHAVKKRKL